MTNEITGRKEEQKILKQLLISKEAEMVSIIWPKTSGENLFSSNDV